MSIKLYVGNLPYQTTEQELTEHFGQVGQVNQVQFIMDKMTKRPRGFGFVVMENKEEGEAAIRKFHGSEFGGRKLTVNEAKPMEHRPRPQGASSAR